MLKNSVGITETQFFSFGDSSNGLILESGAKIGPITIAYETYGKLNSKKDNAILVVHALSANAHAAGQHELTDAKPGWWDPMIGPSKAIDTNKYFVICSNILGGCSGTTGPSSINPLTNKSYGLDFPVITIKDMVEVQKKLIDHLGITCLFNVIGGSMGGMQVLEWAITYPHMIKSATIIASTSKLSAQSIAFNAVGRNAIMSDPNWNMGNYYDKTPPHKGLAIARMIGHITYLSDESMRSKFGRKLQDKKEFGYDFSTDFEIESYLQYQGVRFVERFDANSYLYITKAMDYFDLAGKYGSLTQAFKNIQAKLLAITFSSDWLFPSYESKEIVSALMKLGKDVSYCDIESSYGHDAFLLEYEELSKIVSGFLQRSK